MRLVVTEERRIPYYLDMLYSAGFEVEFDDKDWLRSASLDNEDIMFVYPDLDLNWKDQIENLHFTSVAVDVELTNAGQEYVYMRCTPRSCV